MVKKVLGAVLALTATAVAVKVVSDILEASKPVEEAVIDLDELAAKQAEPVMAEVKEEAEQ